MCAWVCESIKRRREGKGDMRGYIYGVQTETSHVVTCKSGHELHITSHVTSIGSPHLHPPHPVIRRHV